MKGQPIGIFDSGVGGLTVAHAIKQILPAESLIYFGDTAHLPYGDKSEESIRFYSGKITEFLLGHNAKVVLIACNSASASAFEFLKKEFGDSFKLLNIFTTKSLRYARLKERPFRPLTNDEACSRDYSEIEKLDKGGPIAFADFTVHNDSTLEDLNINLRIFL